MQERVAGWSLSLANPKLDTSLRADIEGQYGQSKARIAQLQNLIAEHENKAQRVQQAFDPRLVVDRLQRLSDVLAGSNPTEGNIELSRHVEKIECFDDGKVVLRTTPLGIFDGAVQLLRRPMNDGTAVDNAPEQLRPTARIKARRRRQLRGEPPACDAKDNVAAEVDITNPQRFAELGAEWFWEDVLEIQRPTGWAQEHATEVAAARATGKTHEQLAAMFNVTVPTIRKAIKIAQQSDGTLTTLPRKMPRARWPEQHFEEVADLRRTGMSMTELCNHFHRSEPLIRTALKLAAEQTEAVQGSCVVS